MSSLRLPSSPPPCRHPLPHPHLSKTSSLHLLTARTFPEDTPCPQHFCPHSRSGQGYPPHTSQLSLARPSNSLQPLWCSTLFATAHPPKLCLARAVPEWTSRKRASHPLPSSPTIRVVREGRAASRGGLQVQRVSPSLRQEFVGVSANRSFHSVASIRGERLGRAQPPAGLLRP